MGEAAYVAEAVGFGGDLVAGLLAGQGKERKDKEREVVGVWATTRGGEASKDGGVR
ncbi:hypothetical protein Droror1_Dr00012036, partial [Drosera rotundifolia]